MKKSSVLNRNSTFENVKSYSVLDRYLYCQIVRVKGCMNDLNTASVTGQLHFKLHLATNAYFICNTLLNQSVNQTVSQRVFIPVVCTSTSSHA